MQGSLFGNSDSSTEISCWQSEPGLPPGKAAPELLGGWTFAQGFGGVKHCLCFSGLALREEQAKSSPWRNKAESRGHAGGCLPLPQRKCRRSPGEAPPSFWDSGASILRRGWRCPVPAAPPQPLAAFPWGSWWLQPPCPSSLPSAGARRRGDGRTGCPRGAGASSVFCRQMQTPGALLWFSDHSNSPASPRPAHQRRPSQGEPPADRTELCFPHGAERSELCCRGARKTREIKRMNRYGLIVCL